jgi:hypothetical protein
VQFKNTAKSLIWILKMNKLKTKYNALAQCKLESLSLSIAHLPYTKRWNSLTQRSLN